MSIVSTKMKVKNVRIRCSIGSIFLLLITAQTHSSQSLEDVVVSNNPAYLIRDVVGVKGLPSFDAEKKYLIVLTPPLDTSSVTGVEIPHDTREAVAQLEITLPDQYKHALRTLSQADQFGEPTLECESRDRAMDQAVLHWVIVYWDLENKNSPLVDFYTKHILSTVTAEPIAYMVMIAFCQATAESRNR